MSSYGASGGFWVSTPAASVFADPGTLTGSIGVLGGKFNISGAATELASTAAKSFAVKTRISTIRSPISRPRRRAFFTNQILGDTYQYFLHIVAEQRHMTTDQVNNLAQGRVWTGIQAAQNGLIDGVGGFETALTKAEVLAKLDPRQPVQLEELPEPPGLLKRILGSGLDGSMGWRAPAALVPLLWMVRQSVSHHGSFGAVYCPLVPVM